MTSDVQDPSYMLEVSSLLDQIRDETRGLNGLDHEKSRKEALATAKKLVATLENPAETIAYYSSEVSANTL